MTSAVRNVIIIGSGPAGLTACIYAARANLKPLCIEGFNAGGLIPGGQLMFTTDVENYPGFPEKVTGQELMQRFRDQAEHQGTEIITADVSKVDLSKPPFKVWVGDAAEPTLTKTVIIATGARANYLGLSNEEKLKNKGVSACAVCDGALFRGEPVAVVGGGDTAMEEASYLAGLCSHVTLIHRRDEFRASKAMQDRVFSNPKIKVLYSHEIRDVSDVQKDRVTAIEVEDKKTNARQEIPVSALFVAIGHTPMSELFVGQVDLHPNGYIKTVPGKTETSVPGVFACGDVQDWVFRQAVTAAGTGCMAALEAERYLGALGGPLNDRDPREELAHLAVALRAHAEWQIVTGATGVPRSEAIPQEAAATPTTTSPSPSRPTPPSPSPPTPTSPSPASPIAKSPDAKVRLLQLAEEVKTCTKCPLHSGRTQTVFARGNPDAELCFIGEGPGADEDAQGYPFVGKAGQLLDKMIAAMGFQRDEVYVCNIVKCRPPGNRKPEPDEMATCVPYLREQLELVSPKVIVALGATAVEGLIGMSGGITRIRGQWKLYRTIPVMPTFHPAYLLRNPAAKKEVWADLQAVLKQLGRPVPPAGRSA